MLSYPAVHPPALAKGTARTAQCAVLPGTPLLDALLLSPSTYCEPLFPGTAEPWIEANTTSQPGAPPAAQLIRNDLSLYSFPQEEYPCSDNRLLITVPIRVDACRLLRILGILYDVERATGTRIVGRPESRSTCLLQVTGSVQAVQDAARLLFVVCCY